MIRGREGAGETYEAALGLAWLGHTGCRGVLRLLKEEGPDAVWRAPRRRLQAWGIVAEGLERFVARRQDFDATTAQTLLAQAGLRFLPYGGSLYPGELAHLRLPPAGLFARASEEALERLLTAPRVTLVGTRRASSYGLRAAEAFASAFAGRGVVVVSGLALGVDGRAHQAAIDRHGLTAAVLGCGTDVVYPRRHRWLYDSIAKDGVLLSELPPGTAPARWTFPHRNRLLAALGDAVMVVEASKTSGALQTANWALALGRPVFSVPGSIYADGCQGCNMLLYDGANPAIDPCVTVEDFLLQTRIERGRRRADTRSPPLGRGGKPPSHPLDGRIAGGESVLEILASGPSSIDDLMARTGLSARELSAALAGLELAGLAKRTGPGLYIRAP